MQYAVILSPLQTPHVSHSSRSDTKIGKTISDHINIGFCMCPIILTLTAAAEL